MAKHQIIYTSCMRGIDGINDGQQIFSYDASFTDNKADEVKSLFTYQVPSLPPGVILDEEIAMTMPSAFSYRHLDSGKGAVTLNTYLGRDYMGSAGRFGNHLSHSILCDDCDFNVYPCEMYGSTILRSHMEYEEVNNPNPPEYLPVPELEKGYTVDVDNVIEFLGIGDNLESYKNMLYALLRFETDRKRIVICDQPENIIMWIAALEYTFPLEVVKKINFTTYEFDPELSPAQICGVISEGTKYNAERYVSLHQHFLFDFIAGNVEKFDLTNSYFGFVDTAMSFSYDSLTDFHAFLRANFTYQEADERIFDAYTLYEIDSDGLKEITQDSFGAAIQFAAEFGRSEVKTKLVHTILNNVDTVDSFNDDYALSVIRYLLESMDILGRTEKEAVKQIIVNRILLTFSSNEVMEEEFNKLFDTIDELAKSINLSIASELMKSNNCNSLLQIMQQGVASWKMIFIVQIISKYVIANRIPIEELFPDRPIGNLYYGIVKTVYASGRQNGFLIMDHILGQFENYSNYFVNMVLNMEGYLADLSLGEMDSKHLWDTFYDTVGKMQSNQIDEIYQVFSEYSRHEEMFLIYQKRMAKENDLAKVRELFKNVFEVWLDRDAVFGREYVTKVMNVYAENLMEKRNTVKSKILETYSRELLQTSIDTNIDAPFVNRLIQVVVEYMPLRKLEKDDGKLITSLIHYQQEFKYQKIDGKLLLLAIGMKLGNIKNRRDVIEIVKQIKQIAVQEGADLRKLGDKEAYNYLDWIIPLFTEYRLTVEDMAAIYELFQMTSKLSNEYMEYCCKEYYKKSKEDKDYHEFCEFLLFMFTYGDVQDRENMGKVLGKLNKQKLDELDNEVRLYLRREVKFTKYWGEIVEDAESTNPLLKNISSLFKRRKE